MDNCIVELTVVQGNSQEKLRLEVEKNIADTALKVFQQGKPADSIRLIGAGNDKGKRVDFWKGQVRSFELRSSAEEATL